MNLIKYLLLIGLFGVLYACEKINIPKESENSLYTSVYLPSAVSVNRMDLVHKDTTYTITIGANFAGGLDYSPKDIPLEFHVNLDSVESFNIINNTNYKPLPLASLNTENLNTLIKKGTLSSDLIPIYINPSKGMDLFEEYLLPITMSTVESENVFVNQKLSTAYFIIKSSLNLSDFQDFDRSNWRIINFSSQEETGEGANNGRTIHLLDNDYSTFWHTRWSGGNALGPHYVEIDMGETKTIHGLSVVGRIDGGRGRPERVKFEVKNNESEDWTLVEDNIYLQNVRDNQRLFLKKSAEARYFKLTINKSYENTEFTFLAELNVF